MVTFSANRLVWVGDLGDQLDHLADLLGRVGHAGNGGIGVVGLGDRRSTVSDAAFEFWRMPEIDTESSSAAAATVWTLAEACSEELAISAERCDVELATFVIALAVLVEIGRGARQRIHGALAVALERRDQSLDLLGALFTGRPLLGIAVGKPRAFDGVVLEHLNGARHLPDFILAGRRHRDGHVAAGQSLHDVRQPGQRRQDAAAGQEHQRQQHREAEGKGDRRLGLRRRDRVARGAQRLRQFRLAGLVEYVEDLADVLAGTVNFIIQPREHVFAGLGFHGARQIAGRERFELVDIVLELPHGATLAGGGRDARYDIGIVGEEIDAGLHRRQARGFDRAGTLVDDRVHGVEQQVEAAQLHLGYDLEVGAGCLAGERRLVHLARSQQLNQENDPEADNGGDSHRRRTGLDREIAEHVEISSFSSLDKRRHFKN
jgi:hypothetical protein